MEFDRVGEWEIFSGHMKDQYLKVPHEKYGEQEDGTPDFMHWTTYRICVWNILKYAFRMWNKRTKGRELEKIAHYAQIAWTLDRRSK